MIAPEVRKGSVHGRLCAGCVSGVTSAAKTGMRKAFFNQFFQTDGTQAQLADMFAAAVWALSGHFSGVTTEMAEQPFLAAMPDQGLIVIGTAQTVTAVAAKNVRSAPTAVEKKDSLLIFAQYPFEFVF